MSPNEFTSAVLSTVALLSCAERWLPKEPQGHREPVPAVTAPPQEPAVPAGIDPKYDLGRTHIDWVEGLDAALGRDKPILLFQLLGRFDDAMC